MTIRNINQPLSSQLLHRSFQLLPQTAPWSQSSSGKQEKVRYLLEGKIKKHFVDNNTSCFFLSPSSCASSIHCRYRYLHLAASSHPRRWFHERSLHQWPTTSNKFHDSTFDPKGSSSEFTLIYIWHWKQREFTLILPVEDLLCILCQSYNLEDIAI